MLYAQHGDVDVAKPAIVLVFHAAKHAMFHCFGLDSEVSSHAEIAAKSWGSGWDSTDSTSLVCSNATNFDRSDPENVTDFPSCFISDCAS